jgi:hypothetical protein
MEETSFLTLGEGLIIEQIIEEAHRFVALVRSTMPASCCPLCGDSSDFIHSQYQRQVADAPSRFSSLFAASPATIHPVIAPFLQNVSRIWSSPGHR